MLYPDAQRSLHETSGPWLKQDGHQGGGSKVFDQSSKLLHKIRLVGRRACFYFGRGPGQKLVNLRVSKVWGFGHEKGESGAASYSHDGGGATAGPALTVPSRGVLGSGTTTPSRYNVSLGMSVRNLLNHNNPGPIIGDIASPLFGRSNQMPGSPNGEGFTENASNRRLELQVRFTY